MRAVQHRPEERARPTDDLVEALRDAIAHLRRWAGEPPDPDTGERAPVRQRVPA